MKRLIVMMVFLGLATIVAPNHSSAAGQAAGLTSHQIAQLKAAHGTLLRGYEDLLATPPDTKGDTTKLEGHLKAALDELHAVDPGAIPAAPTHLAVQDKGQSRKQILDAVMGHLESAKKLIEGAKVSNTNVKNALGNIGVAEAELNEVRSAPAVK
jgi:hypothetical protein